MDVERVKTARPHLARAAAGAIVLLIGLIASLSFDPIDLDGTPPWKEGFTPGELVAIVGVALALIGGVTAVRGLARAARVATHLGEGQPSAPLGYLVSVLGYLVVLLVILSALGLNPAGLLLGGAFTGIVLGIASQQTLGNVIAGFVLMIVRPFQVGENVLLKSGPIGGEYEGLVTEIGLFYTKLETASGAVALPNAGVLACAVGPGARSAAQEGDEEEEQDPGPAHGGTSQTTTPG